MHKNTQPTTGPDPEQTPREDDPARARGERLALDNLRAGVLAGLAAAAPTSPADVRPCETATGPNAYLVALVDYAVQNLLNNGQPVNLDWLQTTFCQPFGSLETSCEASEARLRQARLAIEVLRTYLNDNDAPTDYLLSAYKTLLIGVGTSYDEIRLALRADAATRETLAGRLGIAVEHLNELFLLEGRLTEQALALLFGLAQTEPLAPVTLNPAFKAWQQQYLRALWMKADYPADPARYLAPIIEPDLIDESYLLRPAPGDPAYGLWLARRDWTAARMSELAVMRQGQPTEKEGFEVITQFALGASAASLLLLNEARDRGEDIERDLDDLALALDAFNYLVTMYLILANPELSLLPEEWVSVYSILTQVSKRRAYAGWRQEELANGLGLTPDYFKIPVPDPLIFPPPPPRPLPPWRATVEQLQNWESILRSRIDQSAQEGEALRSVVGAAENVALPTLRDYLLMKLPQGGTTLDSKAVWFTENFQVDAQMIASQMTTRVGQATETLQGILWAVRTGQLEAAQPELKLVSEAGFDADWPWLGSYINWRAGEMVRLYPENYMQPSQRPRQTPAFRALVEQSRAYRSLSPQQARTIANTYSAYYRDVSTLVVGATCLAETRTAPAGSSEGTTRQLYYMFAVGGTTQTLYWSVYDPVDQTGYAQGAWAAVPGLGRVSDVVGAVRYTFGSTLGFLFLFALTQEHGVRRLLMTRFNLETRSWDAGPTEISAPNLAADFSAALEQRLKASPAPPALVVRTGDGSLYTGSLGEEGTSLDSLGWVKLEVGQQAVDNLGVLAYVRGLDGAWWLVLRIKNGKLRILPSSGDPKDFDGRFLGTLGFPNERAYMLFRTNVLVSKAKYVALDSSATAVDFQAVPPTRVAVTTGMPDWENPILASWNTADETYRCEVTMVGSLLNPGTPVRVAPFVKGPFLITDALNEEELRDRQQQVDKAFTDNEDGPAELLDYLAEAYYYAPIQLSTQLQTGGQYITALDWLRTVYDYTLPPGGGAKVYPELRRELKHEWVVRRSAHWAHDPRDAHNVALTRPASLTRFVLLSEIGCFLAYADSEFGRDTSESVPRARTLYMNANRLLDAFDALPNLSEHVALGGDAPAPTPAGTTVGERLRLGRERLARIDSALLSLPTFAEVVRSAGEFAAATLGRGGSATAGGSALPIFVTPPNPVLLSLRLRSSVSLYKLLNGLNIAGMVRQFDPYAGAQEVGGGVPVIGGAGELPVPAAGASNPTPYRYAYLIERAKQLVGIASQVEASLLAALEKRDVEYYNLMRAQQDLGLARAGVQLQDLRVREAQGNVTLAQLGQQRAGVQAQYYQHQLDAGVSELEKYSLILMGTSAALQAASGAVNLLAAALPASISAGFPSGVSVSVSPQGSAMALASSLSSFAGAASTTASVLSTLASYERRAEEWKLQKSVAMQDVLIGGQQVTMAMDQVRVVGQDRNIAAMQADNASTNVAYLANKFTNAALYDWMIQVLDGIYRFFLQQATGVAQVAAEQLAFEREETPPFIIHSDYWVEPEAGAAPSSGAGAQERHGLTGSARLLQDITRLDQYAFSTARRKLQLTKTVSLFRLAPAEFQRFKQTGVIQFATPLEMFDRDFPGHYLRLVNRVRVSVVALIPAIDSIKAALTSSGTSRVVVGANDVFRTVVVSRPPEAVALTAPRDATGLFELQAAQPELLLPFEGIGVDAAWVFSLPRASNLFAFETIADVLVTLEYTALDSYTYRAQVTRSLNPFLSAERPFSFRQELPDQWYDLNNPDQSATPMAVRFETRRDDFPPNVQGLGVSQLAVFFVRPDGSKTEVPVDRLTLTADGKTSPTGGGISIDGVISTRRGNAPSWLPLIGWPPTGEWELVFPDTPASRKLFADGDVEDIIFDITYAYRTHPWPQ